MKPDGDFLVGAIGLVLVILGITFAITFGVVESHKRQLEFAQICQKDGKQVQFREMSRTIVSECK